VTDPLRGPPTPWNQSSSARESSCYVRRHADPKPRHAHI
jgi:hypothetical protein